MQTLGIYAQVPFCSSKCSFCNFTSQVAPAAIFDSYCRALAQEIARLSETYKSAGIGTRDRESGRVVALFDLPVDTVYFGGGTPSLLGAARIRSLVNALRRRFHFTDPVEFTLELTPESADEDELARLHALGINRLSIGAQSFNDQELRAVGRLHSAAGTAELVRQARDAGFRNVSLDLIASLPHQTEPSWLRSLRAAAELRPEHISVYLFEVDEKSRLGAEVLRHGTRYHAATVPDDEFMADAYETARRFLAEQGYLQYEISNFALPGFESRHNRKYWRLEPYVGLGAGAHSFDGVHRWANETAPEAYQARLASGQSPLADVRALSAEEQVEEFFFLGLRERAGVDLEMASERWGREWLSRWERKIASLARDGWIERAGERIHLPEQAYLVSNEIFQEFLAS